jgi:hypothetical protein
VASAGGITLFSMFLTLLNIVRIIMELIPFKGLSYPE